MYQILILPIISGLVAQTAKFFIKSNGQQFNWKNLVAYSGMPSGHSAMVVSLAAITALKQGFSSPFFAISAILAIIIIRDAIGLRRYLGQHGEFLNILIKDLGNDQVLEQKYPRLQEHIGHTPAQIFVGALIGLAVSLAGYFFFP